MNLSTNAKMNLVWRINGCENSPLTKKMVQNLIFLEFQPKYPKNHQIFIDAFKAGKTKPVDEIYFLEKAREELSYEVMKSYFELDKVKYLVSFTEELDSVFDLIFHKLPNAHVCNFFKTNNALSASVVCQPFYLKSEILLDKPTLPVWDVFELERGKGLLPRPGEKIAKADQVTAIKKMTKHYTERRLQKFWEDSE